MKTLTVTYHHTCNYGALLQTYALQQAIIHLGNENTVFEYIDGSSIYNHLSIQSPSVLARSLYVNMLTFIRRKQMMRLNESFRQFHLKRLNLSRVFNSMQDLRDNPPDVDCLITGSDQVWNMGGNKEFRPARFLDFGRGDLKRISYAASIEALNYSEEQKKLVSEWLKNFNGISLREESARLYIEDIIGKSAIRVLDPVFLLTQQEWKNIEIQPRIKSPYILCYQVQSNKRMQEVADKLKKETGYPVVSICNSAIRRICADYTFYDVSPEEFLGFYQNASVVVSASFHGTALGIVFNKPTYGLVRAGHSNRISEILNLFGLGEFCISDSSKLPQPVIDTNKIQNIMQQERENSIRYLKEHLKI